MQMPKAVTRYETGMANVPVHFPNGDVCCRWCPMFLRFEEPFERYSCRLTGDWIADIGARQEWCPLKFEEV